MVNVFTLGMYSHIKASHVQIWENNNLETHIRIYYN